jgi:hypothetical protein
MTVRKGEPMDHLAATDEEFDALLEASSLAAPHVIAETGDIPATARRCMAQAVHRGRLPLGTSEVSEHPQAGDEPETSPKADRSRQEANFFVYMLSAGKTVNAALLAWLYSAPAACGNRDGETVVPPWMQPPARGPIRSALWQAANEKPRRGTLLLPCISHGSSKAGRGGLPSRRVSSVALPALRGLLGEAQGTSFCGFPCAWEVQRSPGAHACTTFILHTLDWEDVWRSWQRLRAPWHAAEPWGRPSGSTAPPACTTPPTYLHINVSSTYAYRTARGGLLVPKTIGALSHACRGQETAAPSRHSTHPARTDKAKLRQTVVHGAPELSTELPTLFHFDERESLALVSSLRTRLIYRVSDPYAVEARFKADGQDETVWTFSRDLLKRGLEHKNGLGDVVVWPYTTHKEPRVFIRLSSPDGVALLSVADSGLRAFLEATRELVAYGDEHSHVEPALKALETTMGELARPGRRD